MIPFILWIQFLLATAYMFVCFVVILAVSCVATILTIAVAAVTLVIPNLNGKVMPLLECHSWKGGTPAGDDSTFVCFRVPFKFLARVTGADRADEFVTAAFAVLSGSWPE